MVPVSNAAKNPEPGLHPLELAVLSLSAGIILLLTAFFWPAPLVIVFAMSGGAGLMLLAFAFFWFAVFKDLRSHQATQVQNGKR